MSTASPPKNVAKNLAPVCRLWNRPGMLSAPVASTLRLAASVVFAAIFGYELLKQESSPREPLGLAIVIVAGALAVFAARAPESGASD